MKVWQVFLGLAIGFVLGFFIPDWVTFALVAAFLLTVGLLAMRKEKPGLLVLCIDCSGSMHGPRKDWADALTESVLKRCRQAGRSLVVLPFDHTLLDSHVYPGGQGEFRPMPWGGGTAFEPVLTSALMTAGPGGEIVVLTDGYAQLQLPWLNDWHKERIEYGVEVRTFALLSSDGTEGIHSTKYIEQFSDRVIPVTLDLAPQDIAATIQPNKEF